jgi:hypothetical protein
MISAAIRIRAVAQVRVAGRRADFAVVYRLGRGLIVQQRQRLFQQAGQPAEIPLAARLQRRLELGRVPEARYQVRAGMDAGSPRAVQRA